MKQKIAKVREINDKVTESRAEKMLQAADWDLDAAVEALLSAEAEIHAE